MSLLKRLVYSLSWDTRCRNSDVGRLLSQYLDGGTTILDAGCGEYGIAAFLSARSVIGVDILPTTAKADGFLFVHGSVLALPFSDRAFPVAVSVDVLEHLPKDLRLAAVSELVRCAEKVAIITFPSGSAARAIDEKFRAELIRSGGPIPDWLQEHLENVYPDENSISEIIGTQAARLGRKVSILTVPSESLSVARSLRWGAARSKYLYLIGNLIAGILMPLMPAPNKTNAYRSIVVAEFSE
jgi:SAM-dependent methyltransferase